MFKLDYTRVGPKGHRFVELERVIRKDPEDIESAAAVIEENYEILAVVY